MSQQIKTLVSPHENLVKPDSISCSSQLSDVYDKVSPDQKHRAAR